MEDLKGKISSNVVSEINKSIRTYWEKCTGRTWDSDEDFSNFLSSPEAKSTQHPATMTFCDVCGKKEFNSNCITSDDSPWYCIHCGANESHLTWEYIWGH